MPRVHAEVSKSYFGDEHRSNEDDIKSQVKSTTVSTGKSLSEKCALRADGGTLHVFSKAANTIQH